MALQLKFNPLTGQFDYVQDISGKTDKVNPSTQDGVVKFSDTVGTQADSTVGNYAVKIIDGKLVPHRTDLSNTLIIGEGSTINLSNTFALGNNLNMSGAGFIIGNDTTTSSSGAFGIGNNLTLSNDCFAIGNDAIADNGAFESMAIGNGADAGGLGAMAIGDNANSSGTYGTAIGLGAQNSGGGLALGAFADDNGNTSCIVLGPTSATASEQFVASPSDYYLGGVFSNIAGGFPRTRTIRATSANALINQDGSYLNFYDGAGTGNVPSRGFGFFIAPAGVSGSTQNPHVQMVTVTGDGKWKQDAITGQTANLHEWQGSDADGRTAINPEGRLILDHDTYTDVLAVGAGSDVTGNNAMSLGSNATAGLDAMAIGANSSCTGTDSLSLGIGVSHTRNQSVAIGTSTTTVNGVQSIAIGDGANAGGGSCIAIGYTATTGINLGLAIGWEANSTGTISSALGPGCDALALFSSCVGVNTTVESGNSVACGPFANIGTSANQSVAIGNSATVNNNASQGVAIGNSAVVGAGDVGSMAFGAGASTTAANQLLLGGTTGVTDAYIGKGVTNATPLSITVQPTGETGTDSTNTADFHLAGSKGTGTGTGGKVKLQVGVAGTTGTTLNSLVDAIEVGPAGAFGNVGMGGPASTDVRYMMTGTRNNSTGAIWQLSNPNGGGSAKTSLEILGDTGSASSGVLEFYPSASTVDAYAGRITLRNGGGSTGVSIAGATGTGTVRIYAGGVAATNKIAEAHPDYLQLHKGLVKPTRTVTASTTIANTDYTVRFNISSNTTQALPSTPTTGQCHHIKNVGTATLTLTGTVDGATNLVIVPGTAGAYPSAHLQYNGTDWDIL